MMLVDFLAGESTGENPRPPPNRQNLDNSIVSAFSMFRGWLLAMAEMDF